LAGKLAEPERKYDAQLKVVFDAKGKGQVDRVLCLVIAVEGKSAAK